MFFFFLDKKNYSFLSQNSLKHSKIFVIQILYRYHKSPLIHTNVYHLFFLVQILIFLFYSSQFLSQSINSNVLLGFNFLWFSISFLNIIPCYHTSFFKYIYIYIYKHTHRVIYISLLSIITLKKNNN